MTGDNRGLDRKGETLILEVTVQRGSPIYIVMKNIEPFSVYDRVEHITIWYYIIKPESPSKVSNKIYIQWTFIYSIE